MSIFFSRYLDLCHVNLVIIDSLTSFKVCNEVSVVIRSWASSCVCFHAEFVYGEKQRTKEKRNLAEKIEKMMRETRPRYKSQQMRLLVLVAAHRYFKQGRMLGTGCDFWGPLA